ncbi:tetratricopeptide repeat protein [Sediminicola sp. 1XM1-17]
MLVILALFCLQASHAQEDFLAKQYFNDGSFEKALIYYQKLAEKNPRRPDYLEGLVACYQQLERYDEAEKFLVESIQNGNTYPTLLIELGHNYDLQSLSERAKEQYEKALARIDDNPNYGYVIGSKFQQYVLLDYATKAFIKAMALNPNLDYNFQLARIYGEQGDIEKMYESYLTLISNGSTSKSNILRNIDDFISSDPANENNIKLKRILLQNAQKNPDILWNELLSWLFIQQKQYNSAFNQEKAIYKRDPGGTLQRLVSLGNLAMEENATEDAKTIFQYIVDNGYEGSIKLNAELSLIEIDLLDADDKKLEAVDKNFQQLMESYGYNSQSLQLQIAYANFLTFKMDQPDMAISILKKCLELPLNKYGSAYIKMALGDILVYDQKFNEALIDFSQVQKDLKNDVLAQDARFKVAQTSFYKGDFDWALTQLKVLRSSTSQLIANDAMQLSLLISDNSLEDSTQTALKKYAKADLLAYQKKTKEAIAELNDILEHHKGEKIEDEALFKQGQLLESLRDYEAAKFNYQKIITFYSSGILADDAYYALAELYKNKLNDPDKAKDNYEKIIYDYQDSYYFPLARKNYRILRGDAIN